MTDWLISLALTAVLGYLAAAWLVHHSTSRTHPRNSWLLLGLLAGPGTWIALALRPHRARSQLVGLAGLLNVYWTTGTYALAEILRVIQ